MTQQPAGQLFAFSIAIALGFGLAVTLGGCSMGGPGNYGSGGDYSDSGTTSGSGGSGSETSDSGNSDSGSSDSGTTTEGSAPEAQAPAPAEPAAPAAASFEIGSPFDQPCAVAWPSAPVVTSSAIQLTLSCGGVPSTYPLVVAVYPDPSLSVTPSTGKMRIVGAIVDTGTSQMGMKFLIVSATSITFL